MSTWARAGARLQLNVSVTNFIPKPFTPFQWAAMAPREVLQARRQLLRGALPRKGVKLATHDIDASYLEAALARGGQELADVIEGAWRRGARFDAWTEHYRPDAWAGAFAAAGLDAEGLATTPLAIGWPAALGRHRRRGHDGVSGRRVAEGPTRRDHPRLSQRRVRRVRSVRRRSDDRSGR